MTIRAVVSDIGGVLVRIEDETLYRHWEARLGLPEGALPETVYVHPVAQQALVGKATMEELWAAVGRDLGLPSDDLEALKADFWAPSVWDVELLAYIRSLRPQYRTATISDAWPGTRSELIEYVNERVFDVCVFSSEERVCKPDPEIYRRALSRLGVEPQEAVFVDDRAVNVEGAQRVGMHAFQFVSSERTRKEIEKLIQR